MRVRFLTLTAFLLPLTAPPALASQTGRDKKKDPDPQKKDKLPEKITAATEINGKNLDQWIALIPSTDRSQTEVAIKTIVLYGPELAKKAVPALLAELKK